MSRVEIMRCDGCGEVINAAPTFVHGRLVMLAGKSEMGMGDMDLCPGCVAGVKRFLQDHRAPVTPAMHPEMPCRLAHHRRGDGCSVPDCDNYVPIVGP